MDQRRVKAFFLGTALLLAANFCARAANPFLTASDDRAVSAKFSGTEWGDSIKSSQAPLSATVVTRRIAQMKWGAVFETRFEQIRSRSKPPREIKPVYFVATDNRIYLLNEENNVEAAQRLAQLETPPAFEEGSVYGISAGTFTHVDRPWETEISVKGDRCTYLASHSSGHFTKVVWKRGRGLVEYSMGSGAHADGFRLKRATR
jgi:hypothetical protein